MRGKSKDPNPNPEFQFGVTGYKSLPAVECDPFLLKPQPAGTVGAAIQMLQRLDPGLPLFFDCPDCGKAGVFSTVRFSAVVETENKK